MVRRSGGRLQFRRLSLSIHSQLRSGPFGSDFPSNRPTPFCGGHRWRTAWPPSTVVSRHAPEQARDGAEGHRRFRGNTPDAIPGRPYATGDYLTDRNFATQQDILPDCWWWTMSSAIIGTAAGPGHVPSSNGAPTSGTATTDNIAKVAKGADAPVWT